MGWRGWVGWAECRKEFSFVLRCRRSSRGGVELEVDMNVAGCALGGRESVS